MGKTRYLFKKIRDTKGTFHAKMSTVKNRNGIDLTEAEDIKKRWQEYTKELYKIDLHDPDNHNGVITDLEPNILECEIKQALESITMNKASRGDAIPVQPFQILKDNVVNMSANLEFAMNQGKLEVVKQEMARVNVDILGISELKWTGMGEFNSNDHYTYCCGQESLRRNGVAIIVNKRI